MSESMNRCPSSSPTDAMDRFWAEWREEMRQSRLSKAGNSKACHDATIASCDPLVAEYVTDHMGAGESLFITGPTRAGKTWAASAIVLFAINAGREARLITWQDLLDKVKEDFNPAVVEYYSSIDLLAIDDLGREVPTDFAVSKLFQIVDKRVSNMRPTIFTTTYDEQGLYKRLASRDADPETCKCIVSRICGASMKLELGGAKGRGYDG